MSCGHLTLLRQLRCRAATEYVPEDWTSNFWNGEPGEPRIGEGVCDRCSDSVTAAEARQRARKMEENNTVKLILQDEKKGSRVEVEVVRYIPLFEVREMICKKLGVEQREMHIEWRYHPKGKNNIPILGQAGWEKYVKLGESEMVLLIKLVEDE